MLKMTVQSMTNNANILRSEMHQKEFTTRFGLILEAYCRANVGRTEQIWAQVNRRFVMYLVCYKVIVRRKNYTGFLVSVIYSVTN